MKKNYPKGIMATYQPILKLTSKIIDKRYSTLKLRKKNRVRSIAGTL